MEVYDAAEALVDTNVFQLSYLGSSTGMVKLGLEAGLAGLVSSFMLACAGVRPPLRELHCVQLQTMFSHVVLPPKDRGIT